MGAFDRSLYDPIRAGAQASAAVVVPLILRQGVYVDATVMQIDSVIDVGCGEGWWAQEFAKHCTVTGIDGSEWGDAHPLGDRFIQVDLGQPLPALGHFDVAVCLEVGEHLPYERAAAFVADLCALADLVVFSAAIPHQTGAGHINCQWQSWWAILFAVHGYTPDVSLRWAIWNDERVEPWYRQNIVLYSRDPFNEGNEPLDVVHPIIHEWGR